MSHLLTLWVCKLLLLVCIFFFQAEDGIRDVAVTGVQTCALPIWARPGRPDQHAVDPGVHLETGPVGALQDLLQRVVVGRRLRSAERFRAGQDVRAVEDRKSTRLNSSHGYISYAVFCLKKKKTSAAREGGFYASTPTCVTSVYLSSRHTSTVARS